MSIIIFNPDAHLDLREIEEFIAEDNLIAAIEFVEMLEQKCKVLADNPCIGVIRPDLAENLRMFPVKDYLIFYQPTDDGVEIIHVIHGSRDTEALFQNN